MKKKLIKKKKNKNKNKNNDKMIFNLDDSTININYPKDDLQFDDLQFYDLESKDNFTNINTENIKMTSDIHSIDENNEKKEVLEQIINFEEFEENLKKNFSCSNLHNLQDLNKTIELNKVGDSEDEFADFIIDNYVSTVNLDVLCKDFYERPEDENTRIMTNYNNQQFCYYCRNYLVLPDYEIINFLNFHLSLKKYSKYLILVFRLCPGIFMGYNILDNIQLRKFVFNCLNLNETDIDYNNYFIQFSIYNKYKNAFDFNSKHFIYENLFHQANLTFGDYIKCDSCKNYLCPMHIYLSNCHFKHCTKCHDKKWTICGWCKSSFNEELACKYIHKKN